MAIPDLNARMNPITLVLPKPWLPFGLAAALWVMLYGVGAEAFQVLHNIGV